MKTAISLPDPLFQAAEELASRLGVSRSELFQRAMERLLADYDDASITETLNALYASQPSGVPTSLAAMQAASLPDEAW